MGAFGTLTHPMTADTKHLLFKTQYGYLSQRIEGLIGLGYTAKQVQLMIVLEVPCSNLMQNAINDEIVWCQANRRKP